MKKAAARRKQPSPRRQGMHEPVRERVARARADRYVAFAPTVEHGKRLLELELRVLRGLDDESCFDVFHVFTMLSAMMAGLGAFTRVDVFDAMTVETYLQNCREKFLVFERMRLEEKPAS